MQFLIVAYDGTDQDALQRRLNAREAHLTNTAKLKESGQFIAGGAILNEEGQMIGSTLYMDFEDREALQAWLQHDPYTTGNVWKDVEIKPIKLVDFS